MSQVRADPPPRSGSVELDWDAVGGPPRRAPRGANESYWDHAVGRDVAAKLQAEPEVVSPREMADSSAPPVLPSVILATPGRPRTAALAFIASALAVLGLTLHVLS
ncbi:MAG: hypothetical protein AAF721_13180 [Myxococcota bacterium]